MAEGDQPSVIGLPVSWNRVLHRPLQVAVVCTGFAVRPDSVGMPFVQTVGIQGMGHHQPQGPDGGKPYLNSGPENRHSL